jgi:hypothetical protein
MVIGLLRGLPRDKDATVHCYQPRKRLLWLCTSFGKHKYIERFSLRNVRTYQIMTRVEWNAKEKDRKLTERLAAVPPGAALVPGSAS